MGKGIDSEDHDWEDGWDDKVCAAILAEDTKKRAARKAAKDGQQAKEKTDE